MKNEAKKEKNCIDEKRIKYRKERKNRETNTK